MLNLKTFILEYFTSPELKQCGWYIVAAFLRIMYSRIHDIVKYIATLVGLNTLVHGSAIKILQCV